MIKKDTWQTVTQEQIVKSLGMTISLGSLMKKPTEEIPTGYKE